MRLHKQCLQSNTELVVWLCFTGMIPDHSTHAAAIASRMCYHCLLSVTNPRCLMYKSLRELQLREELP